MKPFISIDQQIELLKERGLLFSETDKACALLEQYGYYEIVNGYKDTLLETKDPDRFKKGATFSQLYSLFSLDKEFQYAVFKATTELERGLKTALSYAIAENYGVEEKDYLKRTNYDSGSKNSKGIYEIDKSISTFQKIANKKLEPYKHYHEVHGHIPPWILFKSASFGTMYYFLKLQKSHIKNAVISTMMGLPIELVKSAGASQSPIRNLFFDTIEIAYKFRNRSAHAGRTYNYRPEITFRYNSILHPRMNITEADYRIGYGKNDLFTLISALSFLKNQDIWFNLAFEIQYKLDIYIKQFNAEEQAILQAMGLPEQHISHFSNQFSNQSTKKNIFFYICNYY
ncbi:MAG: Abi family protein [Clostridia bacterium]|nr:Abi family protein [Clostridiales bacterium]MDU7504720.1 Abi family protein [Clostridia bacterium]